MPRCCLVSSHFSLQPTTTPLVEKGLLSLQTGPPSGDNCEGTGEPLFPSRCQGLRVGEASQQGLPLPHDSGLSAHGARPGTRCHQGHHAGLEEGPTPSSAKKTNTDVFARDQKGEKSPPLPRLRAPQGRGAGGNLLGSRGSAGPGDADGPRPAPPPSAGCAPGPAPSPGFPRALSSLPFVSASPSRAPRFPPARTLALSGSPAASL